MIFIRAYLKKELFFNWPGRRSHGEFSGCSNAVLEAENPDKDIHLYINSPGGVITAGMSIYDTMQFIKPDVSTICMGQACSMGAFLLTAGAKENVIVCPILVS